MNIWCYSSRWAATLVAAVVLVASATWTSAQETSQDIAMISAPQLKPDSWWMFQTWDRNRDAALDTWTLKRMDGEWLIVHSEGEGREVAYTRDWGLAQEAILGTTDVIWLLYSPPLSFLSFPLKVGKSWQQSITVSTQGDAFVVAKRLISIRVVRWEEVWVLAGTFQAIRLETQVDGAKATCWYAIEAQSFIRCISTDDPRYDFDLVRFNLTK